MGLKMSLVSLIGPSVDNPLLSVHGLVYIYTETTDNIAKTPTVMEIRNWNCLVLMHVML